MTVVQLHNYLTIKPVTTEVAAVNQYDVKRDEANICIIKRMCADVYWYPGHEIKKSDHVSIHVIKFFLRCLKK